MTRRWAACRVSERQAQDPGLALELVEDGPDGPVSSPGHVDDRGQVLAAERIRVGGRQRVQVDARLEVGDDAQERQQAPDLGPGIEAGRSGEPPRDAGHVQGPKDRVRVPVGSDEYGVVAWCRPRGDPPADLRSDPVRLLRARGEDLQPDRRRRVARPFRPEPFPDARPDLQPVRVVEPDQAVGGVQHRGERSVVSAQDDRASTRVAILECEDVVEGRPTERVDRLVVVAHDRHVAMRLAEQRHELRLRPVRVLEFVDEDVPVPAGDRRARGGRRANQAERQRDLVAEVDAAVRRHERLVGRVCGGQLGLAPGSFGGRLDRVPVGLGHGDRRDGADGLRECRGLGGDPIGVGRVVGRRDVLVLAAAEQRGERGQEAGRVTERAVRVQLELEQVLAEEDHHLRSRQDANVRRQAELEGVLADEAVTKRVERGDGRIGVAVRHQLVDPDGHLLRGLVRERESEDLGRASAARGDQPGDPPGDDLRLAGARPGDHEERAVAVGDRPQLVRVQTGEQDLRTGIGRGRRLAVHGRDEVVPGRDLLERCRFAAAPNAGRAHDGVRRRGGGFVRGHDRSIAARRAT